MLKSLFLGLIGVFMTSLGMAQQSEEKAVKQAITAFAKAGDQHDVAKLETCLDDNYRVVMNRLFGSSEVSVVPRAIYLQKVSSKEWGGDQRKLTFNQIVVNGSTATVHVKMAGKKMTMVSLITLVKNEAGDWKLISDVPMII